MRRNLLFKTLVDILYYLHFIGLLNVIIVLPFGVVFINQVDMNVMDWSLFYWFILIISLVSYIIFLRGLYYLRKMARFLLSNNYFSGEISSNLKKSGRHFVIAGIILFCLSTVIWINLLSGNQIKLIHDTNLLVPFFLMIIGLFFIIQSDSLFLAKNIKEENDLTV